MDILTHHLHGLNATAFDNDLRQTVEAEADRVRHTAGALVGATLAQLRRWADRAGVTGPGRVVVFDSLDRDGAQALVEVTVSNAVAKASLGRYTDSDRAPYNGAMDAWAALTAAVRLLLGGECHPSLVVDLDEAIVLTVVSDEDSGAAGEIGDIFQLPRGAHTAPTFADDMDTAAALHDRCHVYGLVWPPTGA